VVDVTVSVDDEARRILETSGVLVRMAFDAERRSSHGLATEADLLPRTNAMARVISVADLREHETSRPEGKQRTESLSRVSLLDVLAEIVGESAGGELDAILASCTDADRQRLLLIVHSIYTLLLAERELDRDEGPYILLSTGESLVCDDLGGTSELTDPRDDEAASGALSFNQVIATARQRWLQLYAGVRAYCCIHVRGGMLELRDPLSDPDWVPVMPTTRQPAKLSAEGEALQQMNVADVLYAPGRRGGASGAVARATLSPVFAQWCEAVFLAAQLLKEHRCDFRIEAFPIAALGTICPTIGVYVQCDDDQTVNQVRTDLDEIDAHTHFFVEDVDSLDNIGLPTLDIGTVGRLREMLGDCDEKD
jgi:hypothetical protein